MDRRTFMVGAGGLAAGALGLPSLRAQPAREPVPEPHFPDRLHLFVWRNWELADLDRMAQVAGCRPEDLAAVGAALGLPTRPRLTPDQLRRSYITVIRQNWHLLPNDQLLTLLGWTPEKFQ